MRALVTFLMVAAAAALVSCQQYQQQGADNYVDEYAAYDQSPRPAHPTPRSYPTGSAQRQAAAPAAPKPTPVAILKQINKHNEDGSYTYGFEGADGSFKIETKLPTGEVKGKYGFVDDGGKVRVVEYGANKYGFQPAGEGITVAPPTLVDETTSKEALQAQNYQDYQDYQQPARPAPSRPVPRPAPAAPRQQHAYQQPQYQQPAPQQPQYQPAPQQSHTQAIYAPQQQAPSHARAPQTPIFTPAQPYQVPGSSYAAAPRAAAPQHVQPVYEEPSPPSQAFNHGPVQFSPAPAQAQRPQARSQQGGGILDQLARDYALPQGGAAPLHDISFGYY